MSTKYEKLADKLFQSTLWTEKLEVDFTKLTTRQLEQLANSIQSEISRRFVRVEIVHEDGNISDIIRRETGLDCEYKPVMQVQSACRGSNVIYIPSQTPDIENIVNNLKQKYDKR